MSYDPANRPAPHPVDSGLTIADVDRELKDMAQWQIESHARDLDQKAISSTRWEALPSEQRFALRAGNELARRAAVKEKAAAKADEAARLEAERSALAEAQIADLQAELRGIWVGDSASFDVAWPALLQQWQIDQARAAAGATLAAKRAALERI